MTKEEMMLKVIKKYGFENPYTVKFCKCAETYSEKELEKIMKI